MKMQFGYALPFFHEIETMESWIDTLLKHDIRTFEVGFARHVHFVDSTRYEQLIDRLVFEEGCDISVHLPALDIGENNIGLQQEMVQQLKAYIDLAAVYRCKKLVMHPGTMGAFDVPDKTRGHQFPELSQLMESRRRTAQRLAIRTVRECARYAQMKGMRLFVENVTQHSALVRTPEEHKEFIDLTRIPNVGAVVDFGHAYRAGKDPFKFIDVLGHRIQHIHINDNDGTCDYHAPLGKGNIPYQEIMPRLRDIGYNETIIFEIISNDVFDIVDAKKRLESY